MFDYFGFDATSGEKELLSEERVIDKPSRSVPDR
jgi:hypothetical protein